MSSKELEKAGFGGGCHWCTEAVFQSLRGVCKVEQGFISSVPPNETFSEAALVTFDPSEIRLTTLIEVHLHTHSSTRIHAFREKYRSAVYVCNEAQGKHAHRAISELQSGFGAPIITSVLDLRAFQASAEKFQNYYKKNPEGPFCKRYIDPKLQKIRHHFVTHTIPITTETSEFKATKSTKSQIQPGEQNQ